MPRRRVEQPGVGVPLIDGRGEAAVGRARRSTAATVLALASSFASFVLLHRRPPRGRPRAPCRTRRAYRQPANACRPAQPLAHAVDVAEIGRVQLGEAQRERIIGECGQPLGRAPLLSERKHLGALRAAFLGRCVAHGCPHLAASSAQPSGELAHRSCGGSSLRPPHLASVGDVPPVLLESFRSACVGAALSRFALILFVRSICST